MAYFLFPNFPLYLLPDFLFLWENFSLLVPFLNAVLLESNLKRMLVPVEHRDVGCVEMGMGVCTSGDGYV